MISGESWRKLTIGQIWQHEMVRYGVFLHTCPYLRATPALCLVISLGGAQGTLKDAGDQIRLSVQDKHPTSYAITQATKIVRFFNCKITCLASVDSENDAYSWRRQWEEFEIAISS